MEIAWNGQYYLQWSVLLRLKPIGIAILLYSISECMSCGSNSDTKPDLIWAEYSVILLFFSHSLRKRPYLQVFAIRLSVCMYYMFFLHAVLLSPSQFYFTRFLSELRIKF
jgi:hypothetical protein